MELNRYQELAARTIPQDGSHIRNLLNFCLGLSGESGELIDHVKKAVFHGHGLDQEYLAKELGDILWYLAGISSVLKLDFSVIGDINIDKLRRRYPEGFSEAASQAREDTKMHDELFNNRRKAAKEAVGLINTAVEEGDYIVGALLDIDQAFIETADGKGFRVNLGPVTEAEMNSLRKRLGFTDE